MPSMHFGYALWVCTALAGLLKGGPFQPRSRAGWRCMLAAVGLYPASVLFCIIVRLSLCHTLDSSLRSRVDRNICFVLLFRLPWFCS
jgi:hypothetical protein